MTRADLPPELTPDAVRRLDSRTLRWLAHPGNGVLSPDEQSQFDASLRQVMQATTDHLDRSLRRFGPGRPEITDPDLRRSYDRARARLATQAERARATFPAAADDATVDDATIVGAGPSVEGGPEPSGVPPAPSGDADDTTLGELEADVEETTDLLTVLERIAAIEEQQLEHHRAQVLRDVRGVFFGGLVSVAVIVAGVAPLVEAEPHARRWILLWTVAICAAAVAVYAAVRASQAGRVHRPDRGRSTDETAP